MSPEPAGGVFVAVVGPSGAGKDTLLSRAARHPSLDPRVHFVRRVVTRRAVADAEDHDSLDEAAFAHAAASGAFCMAWAAHGLHYGLPSGLEDELASGRVVVANISRGSLEAAAQRFAALHVLEVTARPEILFDRLMARGRETETTIRERLSRQVAVVLPTNVAGHVRIDNSGDIASATDRVVDCLNGLHQRGFEMLEAAGEQSAG